MWEGYFWAFGPFSACMFQYLLPCWDVVMNVIIRWGESYTRKSLLQSWDFSVWGLLRVALDPTIYPCCLAHSP